MNDSPNARDCEHGYLRRKCELCQRNKEIAELAQENAALRSAFNAATTDLDRLYARLAAARRHAAALAALLTACAGSQPLSPNPGHATAVPAAVCPLPPPDRALRAGSPCHADADCALPNGPGVDAAAGSAGAACESTGKCSAWFEEVDLGRGWLNFGGGWYCYGADCPDTCEVSNCREHDACPPAPCSEPPAYVRNCGGELGQICFARHGAQLQGCTSTAPSGEAVVCGSGC